MKNAQLRPIITATFLALIGFGMMIPLLPLFARGFGAGGFIVGLLLGGNQLIDFIIAPFVGNLSDKTGRKPLLVIAFIVLALAYLAVGLSGSLVMLAIVWTVAGIGSSQVLLTQAYIADATSDEERTEGMGLWGAAYAIGFVIGPPLGAVLFARSPLMAAGVAAGFTLLAAMQTLFFVPEPERHIHKDPPRVSLLKEMKGIVLAVIVLYFVAVLAWSKLTSMLALFTQDDFGWGVRQYGMYLGLVGLAAAMMQARWIAPLSRRFGRRRMVVVGFLLMGIGLLLLVLLPSNAIQVFSAIPIAFGFGILTPSLPAILTSEVHPARKGRALGIFQAVSTLARVIAPVLAGFLYDKLSHPAPFVAAALFSLVAAGVVLIFSLKR